MARAPDVWISGRALVINSHSFQSQRGSVVDGQPFNTLIMTDLGREGDLRDGSALHIMLTLLVRKQHLPVTQGHRSGILGC